METFPALDDLLGGGLPYSPCYRSLWGQKLGEKREALWIDTTGDFSVERAVQILEDYQQTPDDLEATLEKLHISTAVDVESIQEIIRALDLQFSGPEDSPRIKCIVIDSITPLLGPYLSAVSAQGHAIMTGLMRYLRHLATRYSLLVLIVNNATLMSAPASSKGQMPFKPTSNPHSAFASTIRKPALGPSFTFMTDATLWVSFWPEQQESEKGSTTHVVEVFRSRFSKSNVWSTFSIASTGTLLPGSA
ncbi:hypothetical protein BT96DRAFT_942151 [Gymnopus androsaceus JB14]|uniref:RecA family profile 1 domain-containing protein n=1 Tax=Gymnopus androsaceus JB14 TaxID=1447944 RepID=A0A6A4HFP8_9AGAR|nr:hypothetical protein BT96DRAFT_942151 [Gymnopus androsaceus JB14]